MNHNKSYKGGIIHFPKVRLPPSGPAGLRYAAVKPSTAAGYLRAIIAFCDWFELHGDESSSLEASMDDYVFWAYDTEEVSRQQVINLIEGVYTLMPTWKSARRFVSAKRALEGWANLKPPSSYLPLPRDILLGCAAVLGEANLVPVAAALLLGFDTYLRHSELYLMRVGDVALSGDPRLLVTSGKAAVLVTHTKAQRKQWVEVREPLVVAILAHLLHGKHPRDFLFGPACSNPLATPLRVGAALLGPDPRPLCHAFPQTRRGSP